MFCKDCEFVRIDDVPDPKPDLNYRCSKIKAPDVITGEQYSCLCVKARELCGLCDDGYYFSPNNG